MMEKRHKLSVAIAAAFAVTTQTPAVFAQDGDQVVEEVFVTGIRGSLMRSIDIKRESVNMTDAISSEDIGKFPDNNIAESLQRITGVAIERNGGEGQFITVRGFGPEFNTVLVNGRTMPTDNPGREFSFDVVPSELVRGVELHKSPLAHMQEGSIGGTVNIQTARPFDLDDFVIAGSIKNEYNTLSEGWSPSLSGLISKTNDAGNFGALLSVNYSDRESRVDSLDILGWIPGPVTVVAPSDIPGADAIYQTNEVYAPRNYYLSSSEDSRERLSFIGALPFQATDALLITIDGFYSDFDVAENANLFQPWFPGDNFLIGDNPEFDGDTFLGSDDFVVDGNGTLIQFQRMGHSTLASIDDGLAINSMPQQMDGASTYMVRPTKSQQLGLNMDWRVNDRLTLVGDLSVGHAENSGGGNSLRIFSGIAKDSEDPLNDNTPNPAFHMAPGADMPSYTNYGDLLDAERYRGHWGTIIGDDIDDDVLEAKLDAKWEFDGTLASVQSGFIYSTREKEKRAIETPREEFVCFHCGYELPLDLQPGLDMLTTFSVPDLLTDYSGDIPREWLVMDPATLLDYYASDEAIAYAIEVNTVQNMAAGDTEEVARAKAEAIAEEYRANGGHAPSFLASNSAIVEEEVFGAYIEANFMGDWGRMPWTANLGLRYVSTDVTATGTDRQLLSVQSQEGDDTLLVEYADMMPISVSSSYNNVLPSVNLALELNSDMKLKFAAAQTLTRPTIADMYPALTISARENNAEMMGGNPYLEPYFSLNFDVAFEWYYSDSSFFGATLFYKDIDEWITNQTTRVPVPQYSSSQDRATEEPERELVFNMTQPANQESATATGIELAFVHTFDNGFGGQFNYTYVDSDAEYSNTNQSFALEGLSPSSYNIVGFYEQENYGVRLAYNWRDDYLRALSSDQGQPRHREAYGQLDMTATYDFSDNFSVFLEGINLLDEPVREYSIYQNRFLTLQQTGTRIALGVRGRF